MTHISKVIFPCTSAIATALAYDTNNSPFCNIFDGTNLVIPVYPANYTKTEQKEQEIIDTMSDARVQHSNRRITIEILIEDAREEIRWALEALIGNAEATPRQYQPITMLDYVSPELSDRAMGYTSRVGVLSVQVEGGSIYYVDGVPSSRRLGQGTRITFVERNRRGYDRIV